MKKLFRYFWLAPNKGADVEVIWSTGEVERFTIPETMTGFEFIESLVEGLDAEFDADPLLFPFTDEELANAWQYLEDRVSELWEK